MKKIQKRPFVIVIICLFAIGIYLLISKSVYLFRVGNFTFLANSLEVFFEDRYSHKMVVTEISSIRNDSACPLLLVGGVEHISLDRKTEDEEREWNNFFNIDSWNFNKLTFKDDSVKEEASDRLVRFTNLENYTNSKRILNLNFGDITVDPWGGLTSCGGHMSFPIYVQEVTQSKFDKVLYVESLEGQDRLVNMDPTRSLIIKNGDDWLWVRERVRVEEKYYDDVENRCSDKSTNDIVVCMEDVWTSKYRSDIENQKWINYFLRRIGE